MLKSIDRAFAVLLLLGAAGHTLGSVRAYGSQPMVLLWSLSATLFVVLLGALHLLRSFRPGDRPLAWIAAAGSLAWTVMSFEFGVLIGNVLDPRPLIFAILSLALAGLSVRSALAAK